MYLRTEGGGEGEGTKKWDEQKKKREGETGDRERKIESEGEESGEGKDTASTHNLIRNPLTTGELLLHNPRGARSGQPRQLQ